MSDTKHTPGPWQVERGHQSDRIYGVKGVTRWNFLLKGSSAQSQANARLIAAAPDMLEALYKIAQGGNNVRKDWPASPVLDRESMCDLARAAIAKATGAA